MFKVGDVVELTNFYKYEEYDFWEMRFDTFVILDIATYLTIKEALLRSIQRGHISVVPLRALKLIQKPKIIPYEDMM